MRAMVLEEPGPLRPRRLALRQIPAPVPAPGMLLVRVRACGVCRTDLHVVEGDLPEPRLPLVPGHQIAGNVEQVGEGTAGMQVGDRVGIPWLGGTDGTCPYCRAGRENLCDAPTFTGYQVDGGYAELALARADFALPLPERYSDLEVAPLLCAGLIGYRALRLAEVQSLAGVPRLGLYGFGASAHIVIQVALHRGDEVHVVTRGAASAALARELGAASVSEPSQPPPVKLDSAIIFAPAGELVPAALGAVRKGGIVVCAGIHMSAVPELPYELLWGERVVRSVANLTRQDGREFLALAPQIPVRTDVEQFALEDAAEALARLKSGALRGAAVLVP